MANEGSGEARDTTVEGLGRFDIGWVIEIPYSTGQRPEWGVFHSVRTVLTHKGVMPQEQFVVKMRTLGDQRFIESRLLKRDDPIRVVRKFVEREPQNPYSSYIPRSNDETDSIVWRSGE